MSTRSQICLKRDLKDFKRIPIYIYKHCDGYPEGVMPILAPFVKAFFKNRGNDPDYLLAQIVRQFAFEDSKEMKDAPETVYYRYTGWGLDCEEHGDIEYLYEIDPGNGDIYINGKLNDKGFK